MADLSRARYQWLAKQREADRAHCQYWNLRMPERGPAQPSPTIRQAAHGGFLFCASPAAAAILEPNDFMQWERGNAANAAALMKPTGEDILQKWPMSKRVNSSRTHGEDATLIERMAL